MTVIKPPAIVVLLRRGAGRGVLFNTLTVTTGLWELTVSVSARTLITVTLLSFSFCFSLKQTLLPPPRATSIAIVTKANPTQQCCRGSVAQKCVYDWTLKAKGGQSVDASCFLFHFVDLPVRLVIGQRQQPLFNVQLQIRIVVTIWRACTHSTYCFAHFRPVLVYVLSVQHLLANESLIKAPVLQHYSPVSLISRIERIQLARSMNHKSATLAEKKNKFRSACWLKTKRFLARATQKGQKTRQNNFSWKSVRLSWSIAECSLLRRSNRQEKTPKENRRRQWIIAWSDSLWKSWNVLTPQMWNRSIAATQNKCICSLLFPLSEPCCIL